MNVQLPLTVAVVVEPATAEPILMFVVDPDTPAVPKLRVFVTPELVAPVAKFNVCAAVD
jgi:hypothetical protein